MSKVVQVTGKGIPVRGNDIDTDRIIPARFLKAITFDGLGKDVFIDDRQALDGRHPFDQPQYQQATVLVVNRNFGCGSSREHAPQAIARWGIRAIVGESFAEIFFGNCVAIGIPCVTASSEVVKSLQATIEQHPDHDLSLNLADLSIQIDQQSFEVSMPPGMRQMFLEGTWDACGQLVASSDQIRATAANLPYLNW